jgi:pimeloyl-ACP methyl ester carboxylesterase
VRGFLIAIGVLVLALSAAGLFTHWKAREFAQRFPAAGRTIDVEGGRIHLIDTLPSAAVRGVIVLVHGASGNAREMHAALAQPLMQRGYRVISVDRPGHGWSARMDPRGDASPARQAVLIRRAIETIGVKEAIIAGHSLAGALTLTLALDHAPFARGIVLIGAVSHPWPGGIATYYSIAANRWAGPLFAHTIALPAGLALMRASLEQVFAPQSVPREYRMQAGIELVLRPDTFRYNAFDVSALYDYVETQQVRYREITVPVAIVAGESDTIVSTDIHAKTLASSIAGARLTILPNVGHTPHWTHTQEVIAAINDVAARVAASKPMTASER